MRPMPQYPGSITFVNLLSVETVVQGRGQSDDWTPWNSVSSVTANREVSSKYSLLRNNEHDKYHLRNAIVLKSNSPLWVQAKFQYYVTIFMA